MKIKFVIVCSLPEIINNGSNLLKLFRVLIFWDTVEQLPVR